MRRRLVLVVVVALAGCSGFGVPSTDDAGPDETDVTTPAPVPTDQPVAYPPGVNESGVNATALARGTERALRGTSYRWYLDEREARPEPGLGSIYVGPRVAVAVSDPRRYAVVRTRVTERGGGLAVETQVSTRFADGERVVVREADGIRSRNFTANDTALGSRLAYSYVARYLAVENASVQLFDNGTVRVEGRGAVALEGRAYEVTAQVGPDGVVQWFDATYVREGRVQFVTYEVTRAEREVTPPPSVLNETASDDV